MLELILGPIKIVNEPKNNTRILTAEEIADTKEDDTNQSDVSIACTAMSCRIEGTKDKNNSTDPSGSVSADSNTTIEERTNNGNPQVNLYSNAFEKL